MPPDTVSLEFLARQQAQLLDEAKATRAESREIRRSFSLISEHFSRQERRVSELRDDFETMIRLEIGGAIANLETRLETELDSRFGAVEGRLTAVETQMSAFDGRLGALGGGLSAVVRGLGALDQRMGSIEGSLAAVDGRLDALEKGLGSLDVRLGSVEGRLDSVDGKLDAILAAVRPA